MTDQFTTTPNRHRAPWWEQPTDGPRLYWNPDYMAEQDRKHGPVASGPRTEHMAARVHVVPQAPTKPVPTRVCERCSETFVLKSANSTQRFCCQSCASRRGGNRFATLTCEVCGKPFEVPYGERNRRKTCGRECGAQLAGTKATIRAAQRKAMREGMAA